MRRSLAVLLLAACTAGCDRDPDTTYGSLRGESLNGVSAFVRMLRDSGRTTNTRRWLGDRMVGRHDVAVVFADAFGTPPNDARAILDGFLDHPGSQTVVFVVRDSDAAIDYWRAVHELPGLAADRAATAQRRLDTAQRELVEQASESFAAGARTVGYGLEPRKRPVTLPVAVRTADASAAPVSARWPRVRRLLPPAGARPVWTHDGEPLLVEQTGMAGHGIDEDVFDAPARDAERDDRPQAAGSGGGSIATSDDRMLILASAAPLLNGGLVDPGNRRLARDLVARLPAGCSVVVVGSAQVRTERKQDAGPSMWRLLGVPPNPWIAAQALLAMVLFCWWKAPIFGRPRRETTGRPENFGHHVAALAALLRRSHDDAFARRRLEAWRRQGEAGAKANAGGHGASD